MTDSEMIDELTTLEAAATPLPWRAMPREFMEPEDVVVFRGCGQDVIADGRHSALVVIGTDQELATKARNHLPRLLALARRSVEATAENARLQRANTEMNKRYDASLKLLRRCEKIFHRSGWEDGETQTVVHDDVIDLLSSEKLEAEIARASLATPQDGGQS